MHNGEEIAVKMLHLMPEHDDLEPFKREFENLRRLKHQNIVQLLGYCYEIKLEYVELSDGRTVFVHNIYRALCFQYMHKGSLSIFLVSCPIHWLRCSLYTPTVFNYIWFIYYPLFILQMNVMDLIGKHDTRLLKEHVRVWNTFMRVWKILFIIWI